MPELPEVETLKKQLSSLIVDKTIADVLIDKRDSFHGDKSLILNQTISNIRRFAKLLVIDLRNGLSLVVHLKMTGQLIYKRIKNHESRFKNAATLEEVPNKYTRVTITFTDDDKLYFNDLRRFGWMKVVRNSKYKLQNYQSKFKIEKLKDITNHLGPDPLGELTIGQFEKILKSSRSPVKTTIMDQTKIGGIGNIYANEALFVAKINPKIPAARVTPKKAVELFKALQKVLTAAIKLKGASRQHFRDAYGNKGKVQEHFLVYDREGEECFECSENITRFKLSSRSTFYCLNCQC